MHNDNIKIYYVILEPHGCTSISTVNATTQEILDQLVAFLIMLVKNRE